MYALRLMEKCNFEGMSFPQLDSIDTVCESQSNCDQNLPFRKDWFLDLAGLMAAEIP